VLTGGHLCHHFKGRITVPSAIILRIDIDRVFIDHFLKGWGLGTISRVMKIKPTVMSRMVKDKHHDISVYAKSLLLPRIDVGSDHGSTYKWVVVDKNGHVIDESNRQAPLFRLVLNLLKAQGVDHEQYIRGIYAP
jgi:hypothetical protein